MWGKVVKEKFVEHLMPEILVPNLSGSRHFDPGLNPTEKWPCLDSPIFAKVCSFFKWSDQADFGVIRQENVVRSALPICTKVIPGFPDPLRPAKLKNGHFWEFLDFSTNKKYANRENEDIHFEAQTTSFNFIPNLSGLDRAPLSYGPGSGEWPENFALSLFGVQIW